MRRLFHGPDNFDGSILTTWICDSVMSTQRASEAVWTRASAATCVLKNSKLGKGAAKNCKQPSKVSSWARKLRAKPQDGKHDSSVECTGACCGGARNISTLRNSVTCTRAHCSSMSALFFLLLLFIN